MVKFADPRIEVAQGWCRVAAIGTGCLLIQRQVFERLAAQGSLPKLSGPIEGGSQAPRLLHDFFGRVTLKDGSRLSEDYSFCARIAEIGQEIWGLADAEVGHVGGQRFSARFTDHLAHISGG